MIKMVNSIIDEKSGLEIHYGTMNEPIELEKVV